MKHGVTGTSQEFFHTCHFFYSGFSKHQELPNPTCHPEPVEGSLLRAGMTYHSD